MNPVTVITGSMAPLPRANVDTDQIMPKQFLKRVERTGYGQYVFDDWRRDEENFVLERPEYHNCTKVGLVPVVLSEKEVQWLIELATAEPDAEITIDIASGTVSHGAEFEATFPLDEFTRYRLLNGLDDIGITLQYADAIDAFEARRPSFKPVL